MRRQVIALIILMISGSGIVLAQTSNSNSPPSTEVIEQQIKVMRDMHQKIQSPMTATERTALLREHMELMHSSMAMLNKIQSVTTHGSDTSDTKVTVPSGMSGMMGMHRQMEHRVLMMEQLMQMMIDRESSKNK